MLGYVVRRLGQAVLVVLAVTLVAFVLFRYVGDPVGNMVGQDAPLAERDALRQHLGLDQPLPAQLGRFVLNAVQGDLGVSYRQQRPVLTLIAERLPATLELVAVSAVLALGLGVPPGIWAAVAHRGWLAHLLMTISLVGVSLPTFVIGILLIHVFAVTLGWLPSFGRGEVVRLGWWSTGLLTASGWRAIALPAATLALYQLTLIVRLVRAEMLEVLRSDHIRFARARGLPARKIYLGHALRNTAVSVVTVVGLQIGSLIAFSIVTESVFQWPGLGLLLIQAIRFADMPVMAGYLVLVALMFVTINLVVDLLQLAIDPRLRTGAAAGTAGR